MFVFLLSIKYSKVSVGGCKTEPGEGQFCCFGKLCDYKCIYDNSTSKVKSHCYRKSEELFCQRSALGALMSIAIAITPSLLFFLIGLCRKYRNYYSFLMSLALNMFWASLFLSLSCSFRSNLWTIHIAFWYGYGMIGIAVILILYYLNLCNRNGANFFSEKQSAVINDTNEDTPQRIFCPSFPHMDAGATYREMNYPIMDNSELVTSIEENATCPPEPKVHWMVTYKSQSDGKYRTETDFKHLPYGSWQSTGETTPYSSNSIMVYRCHINYKFDKELQDEIQKYAEENRALHESQGKYESWVSNSPRNLVRYAISGDNSKFFGCFTSNFNKRFYMVLAALGYHYIMDIIWTRKVKYIKSELTKTIYHGTDGRAKRGEHDNDVFADIAIETPSISTNLV